MNEENKINKIDEQEKSMDILYEESWSHVIHYVHTGDSGSFREMIRSITRLNADKKRSLIWFMHSELVHKIQNPSSEILERIKNVWAKLKL